MSVSARTDATEARAPDGLAVAAERIRLPARVLDAFVAAVTQRHPRKSFGYFVSDSGSWSPTDFVLFDDNIRNDDAWRPEFESYGDYFVEHRDAGFVATPEEAWRRQQEIWRRGAFEVGVFHSHQRHPANFSLIDYEMHVDRFPGLWHLIISMRVPSSPVVRAFLPTGDGVREVPIDVVPRRPAAVRDDVVRRAADLLRADGRGRPACPDAALVLDAADAVLALGDTDVAATLLRPLFGDAGARYEEHVAGRMRRLGPVTFEMGTPHDALGHFYGESPAHPVSLSPFGIGVAPVTNADLALFDPRRLDVPARDRAKPATSVTWAEAALFARWMGCRLPTEAEFEYAAGGGTAGQWCCEDEADLERFAWYCRNSGAEPHDVATREPNSLGLHDLHGNCWEWCADDYDGGWYAHAPRTDPLCRKPGRDKVTRGGSYHSLPEMCRLRYRFHEPAHLAAADLGLRLARTHGGHVHA